MGNKPIWSPQDKKTNLKIFQDLNKDKLNNNSYEGLHQWSVNKKSEFWSSVWDYTRIKGSKIKPILENKNDFFNSIFFKNSKLNFTLNLLNKNNNDDAIVFFSEQNFQRRVTWKKLNEHVNIVSIFLKKNKIKKKDRVAAILPNIPETIISFLATAKIGATWSSCSPDFGPKAIIDRFKQIKPKILIISDEYFYNNKKIKTLNNINEILKNLPTVKEIILINYDHRNYFKYNLKFKYTKWNHIIEKKYKNKDKIDYEEFDFNIPLYILFSSGTTGIPKCIVHGAGGSLIQHKKEHQLHCNIRDGDRVFYFTTCGWMMWNWLVSCLSSNATIYLYDGSPFFPNPKNLLKIIEKEKINFFGTGAKYLDYLKNNKFNFKNINLENLKTIASTGSPLSPETFKYVYKNIKKNIHLCSISGGTDIVSCFVLGNPNESVYAGEIQTKGLGMDVDIFNKKGESISRKKGELVCKSTFPSKPIFFWNDIGKKKFYNTYFSKYKNTWWHGDYAEITKNKGFIIHGRSDATLNSGGIRIGTAELYQVVEDMDEIEECIAVEKIITDDTQIILFIKLNNQKKLNNLLINKINLRIQSLLSPKHLPKKIFSIKEIPKTKSGKIVELTIKDIINNNKINNIDSLVNPQSLKEFKNIAKKLT